MDKKERKKIESIITITRWKMKEAGFVGALIVGKDAEELRQSIKNTFIGLLNDADLEELKTTIEHIANTQSKREKDKPRPKHVQLYMF